MTLPESTFKGIGAGLSLPAVEINRSCEADHFGNRSWRFTRCSQLGAASYVDTGSESLLTASTVSSDSSIRRRRSTAGGASASVSSGAGASASISS